MRDFSPNELMNYKINFQVHIILFNTKVVISHQNIGFCEQPMILMELRKSENESPLIIEMSESEVEELVAKLKQVQKLLY